MTAQMPPVPWHKARKAEARQPLSQAAIVETGIRILDAEGLSGVTMRRIAQDLDTGPASLYAHVSNKDELCELMLERIAGEIELPELPDPAHWKEQVKEICLNAQRVYTSHRDIALVSLGSIPVGENQLRIAEFMLDVMLQAGIPPQVASWALDGLGQLIDSDAYEACAYTDRLQRGDDLDAYFTSVEEYFGKLPPDRFPLISSMAATMVQGDGDDRFAFKLDVFLRGLESYIEQ
ncbi:TetR/AcrR family transcriptional regulator C-terminal domain-containing protein [Kitasatospora sp. NPDC048540]|uniref:TetR/AcrR family transcriptional regulator C-terminal domain-containing protein n=1 Tax=unclassified Kitasatospora TaxID=2633591 RepID=UPI00053BA445|nr:TetR/AcrR family transcriptional regulator C-terminal domain-containing protein [Kitasatospora sp. MBT63]